MSEWYPPRDASQPVHRGWRDLVRQWRHRLGAARRELDHIVAEAVAMIAILQPLDDGQINERLRHCRSQFRRHGGSPHKQRDRLPRSEALALVAVIAERSVIMRPYPVQLLAALGMFEGCLVQMAPGEGKTLSAAIAAVLHGWSGHPCHLMTANEYLAGRDAVLMAPLYQRCGLTVASVAQQMRPEQLAEAYRADIVYGTGQQLLADYLRDQLLLAGADDPLRRQLWQLRSGEGRRPVMRGLHTAIIDEADSLLIDEATTPLIISAPGNNPLLVAAVRAACQLVDRLVVGVHYQDPLRSREIRFTPAGERLLEGLTEHLPPLWHAKERRDDLLAQAIMARDLFQRDRHYVVRDGKVHIVDENTGRVMEGRSWSFGLHQAVEAREGLELTQPPITLARMSFQRFYCHYHRLCGASGTLQGIERELWSTYGLLTLRIPPRLPSRLRVAPPHHFRSSAAKREAIQKRVAELHRMGVPVLVGTRRISDSERLAAELDERGISCAVLNAKEHAHEAEVVAEAGRSGRVTVATNMAGRGTDIHLAPGIAERGGLHVLMVEPHESARVDWQLFGRAGRQGAPGVAEWFVALEDDLLRRHLPWLLLPLLALAQLPQLRRPLLRLMVPIAQRRAQWQAWRSRRQLVKRDKTVNEQLSFAGSHDLAASLLGRGGQS
jgi:preprotein translocase subunit SecA